jgi:hypothetical protein
MKVMKVWSYTPSGIGGDVVMPQGLCPTITTGNHGNVIAVMEGRPILAGSLHRYGFAQADSVWSVGGVSPAILAHLQGQTGHQINILEEGDDGKADDTLR